MSEYKPMSCLPVLALRGLVVFPDCVTHFDVGRKKSVRAVEEAMRADQMIFLVAQRDLEDDDPKKADLYEVGTVAVIKQILRLPGDNVRILTGLFENFTGRVTSIDEEAQRVHVVVPMLKRETDVELALDEVLLDEE